MKEGTESKHILFINFSIPTQLYFLQHLLILTLL